MKPLPTVFSLPLPGNIFRVLADPYSEDWCLEVRDAAKHEAYWLWIPGGDSAEINTLQIPDSWSYTLMDVAAGEMVLGKYEAGGMPVIVELAAWGKNLDSLWHYPDAKEFQRDPAGWLILENGKRTLEQFRKSPVAASFIIESPSVCRMNESLAAIARSIQAEGQLLSQAEWIQQGSCQIISFFSKDSLNALTQWLCVADAQGEVLFSEKVQENLKGFSLDTWSCRNNKLFYISGLQTWKALSLLELS